VYCATTQHVEEPEDSPPLSQKEFNRIQQLGGTLLYDARAVDTTLIMPVNALASEQTKATSATADKIIKLINYYTTHPEATLRYNASDMILNIHSHASYISEREANRRAGGFFYISSNKDSNNELTNGAILVINMIIKHICHQKQKQKQDLYSSMQMQQQSYAQHLKKWEILSHLHHYKKTMQHHHATATIP
jgi:hypothetical protein